MDAETLRGVLLIIGIGLAVLIIAALADLHSAKRAERILASPPEDQNSQRLASDSAATSSESTTAAASDEHPAAASPAVSYVPATVAHQRAPLTPLSEDEAALLDREGAIELTGHLVDQQLATHSTPEAFLAQGVRVLCCPEGIGSPREVMQTLERSAQDHTPVLLAAPAIDPEVVDLLVVNTARGNLSGGAVVLAAGDCIALAESLGGYAVTRADLQSGYVPHSAYGTATCVAIEGDRARWWPAG